MFYWIYDYPTDLIGPLFAVAFVGITWLGIFGLRPAIVRAFRGEPRSNDMIGFTLSSFSTLYGLLIGLLAVAAYQDFSVTSDMVTKEASTLSALYQDVRGLPEPLRGKLHDDLREYARYVVEESWPEQQKGLEGPKEAKLVANFGDDLLSFKPTDPADIINYYENMRQFNNFLEVRRTRIDNITAGIPAVLWWVVAVGAMINIGLIVMLQMQMRLHLVLGGCLSLFLGIVIFLIAAMDNPFRGEVSVSSDPIKAVHDTVMVRFKELPQAQAQPQAKP